MKTTIDSEEVYVWPFCPTIPLRESLEWLSDYRISHNGIDAVERYRNRPRRTYEVSCVLTHPQYTRAANILFDGASYPWAMPIWPERSTVASISAGAGSLSVDTDTASYEDLAIIWESPTKWEVVTVDTATGGTLTLVDTVADDYADARVMPLAIGRLLQIPRSETNRKVATMSFVWQGDDARSDPAAPTQYLADDLDLTCPVLEGSGVQDGYQTRIDVMDEITGLIDTKAPWTANRRTREFKVHSVDRDAAWTHREWLHRRGGRVRAFWAPTFTRDIRVITTGALATQFLIHDDGYESREHVAVRTADGTWLTRAVDSIARIDADTLQLTLTTSLGIDAADISLFCYLIRYRLAADRIELEHIGKDHVVSMVPLMEAPA